MRSYESSLFYFSTVQFSFKAISVQVEDVYLVVFLQLLAIVVIAELYLICLVLIQADGVVSVAVSVPDERYAFVHCARVKCRHDIQEYLVCYAFELQELFTPLHIHINEPICNICILAGV